MELLERGSYLEDLFDLYQQVTNGEGHTVFLMGEAGVGKTSLVNHFVKKVEGRAQVYQGACDSLFTPRPLGPLFDIATQMGPDFSALLRTEKDRAVIFTAFIEKLAALSQPVVLVFEDVHWADEATLDLIKFLARRISRISCLFLLTYRDDELHARHPLATIFGQLQAGSFSKVSVSRFSKATVERLAAIKGQASGDKLYELTGGNPFYVMEILANNASAIPERVKDSILTLFHSRSEETKRMWEFFSILPSRIDLRIADRIEQEFTNSLEECIAGGVIVSKPGYLAFKHELFRMAIEESLSGSRRKTLHRKMLSMMQESPEASGNLSQLVHHAKFAEEYQLVAKLAPQAAREAASVGSHMEASRHYGTAIEYSDKQNPAIVELYERHAYECYLTNQITAAIASQEMVLSMWRTRKVSLREGDALRFLSRLTWFAGNQSRALSLGAEAIGVLENGFPTRERALAYSNLSQLHMLADNLEKATYWGNKAIELAVKMEDNEILSHALNNVGTVLLKMPGSEQKGEEHLNRSLTIALEHELQEHVARSYVNLGSSQVLIRDYGKAQISLETGVKYSEERDLDSWKFYMLNCLVRLKFETGKWKEAEEIAYQLQANLPHATIVSLDSIVTLARLNMRRGKFDDARAFIQIAQDVSRPTQEAQRIVPVLCAALELAWLTGDEAPVDEVREAELTLFFYKENSCHYTNLVYWMDRCGLPEAEKVETFVGPFQLERLGDWKSAAKAWKSLGCPFEEALALIESDEQKEGLYLLEQLGASATSEMLKLKLKQQGVRNIPRGPRESTRNNPAHLTSRQIEILALLQGGSQNKEIAERLFISPKTVDHHISAILSKLEVSSRAKAVVEAQRLGILK